MKMGNKYQEAIGNWEHTIGNITHVMEPEEDDNYRFLRAKQAGQKSNSDEVLFKKVGELYFDMVTRSEPTILEDPEVVKSLKVWISINIAQIVEDFLVDFRWVTKEGLAEKKLRSPVATVE